MRCVGVGGDAHLHHLYDVRVVGLRNADIDIMMLLIETREPWQKELIDACP